jgi:protocatechuate 3,4-dioxygenase beta subunit
MEAGMSRHPIAITVAVTFPALLLAACSNSVAPIPDCEWCGAMDAPSNLTSITRIAPEDEPGERIILKGRVFEPDGVTPAGDVLLYAYHTDITGIYRKDGGETGNGRRHGALRGWLRTDDQGRYEIRTIKPGTYPSRSEPAHVHITLTPPARPEQWADSTLFEGDTLISDEERARDEDAGRFGRIVTLAPGPDGVLTAERDLLLFGPGIRDAN